MEVKYTKDGKKVAIIGELNQNEYIVQEISVTESGDEIPAGDKFTAKGLLDMPVETWKAKEDRKLQNSIENGKEELAKLNRKIGEYKGSAHAIFKGLKAHASVYNSTDFEDFIAHLFDVYSGRYLYKCKKDSWLTAPVDISYVYTYEEHYYGTKRHGNLRTLQVWMKGSGEFKLEIGDPEFELFETLEDAQAYVINNLNKAIENGRGPYYPGTYKQALELGFIPKNVLDDLLNKIKESRIEDPDVVAERARLDQIEKNKKSISELNNILGVNSES